MNDKIKKMIKKTKIGDHITVRTIKGLDMDAKVLSLAALGAEK